MSCTRVSATLLSSVKAGDRRAMEQLLTVSRPLIHRMALQQCGSTADADDATQITLWLVYQRVGALRTLAAFPAWLYSVVRRECWRLSRKVPNWLELTGETPGAVEPADVGMCQDLSVAIGKLPSKYRRVLLLRDIEQRSTDEVAHLLKLTPEAVKSRLHRARQMVRISLAS